MEIDVTGKYNTAKVFTDVVDDASLRQIKLLCDQPFTAGERLRFMPDVHSGAGCTIGTTMTVTDKVVPNLVGVDIGCGMLTTVLEERELDFARLDSVIREHVPSGRSVRTAPHPFLKNVDLDELRCAGSVNRERAELSVGSLGGGNHFIEVDRDDEGRLYLVIHSGSRNLGKQVAEHYQAMAIADLKRRKADHDGEKALIERMKAEGRARDISDALKEFHAEHKLEIPESLAYLQGTGFEDYIHDIGIAQKFAVENRRAMAEEIVTRMGLHMAEQFTTIHNYIDVEQMVLRKGAVSAKAGEKLLIPINMRDGSLICIGKGNDDWNTSAPHGAGRLMSRTEAHKKFTLDEFRETMKGIFSTSVSDDTIDESPMAYKRLEDIVDNIHPTVEIVKRIIPVYNFKAAE